MTVFSRRRTMSVIECFLAYRDSENRSHATEQVHSYIAIYIRVAGLPRWKTYFAHTVQWMKTG